MQYSVLHPRVHVFPPRKIIAAVSSTQTGASSTQVRRAEPKVRRCDAFIFGRTRARSIRRHIAWCAIVPNNPQGTVQTQSGFASHSLPCETAAFIPRHRHWTTSSDVRHALRRPPGRLNPATTSSCPRQRHGLEARAGDDWPAFAAVDCAGWDEPLSRTTPTL